jgi:hypothetical protein
MAIVFQGVGSFPISVKKIINEFLVKVVGIEGEHGIIHPRKQLNSGFGSLLFREKTTPAIIRLASAQIGGLVC